MPLDRAGDHEQVHHCSQGAGVLMDGDGVTQRRRQQVCGSTRARHAAPGDPHDLGTSCFEPADQERPQPLPGPAGADDAYPHARTYRIDASHGLRRQGYALTDFASSGTVNGRNLAAARRP